MKCTTGIMEARCETKVKKDRHVSSQKWKSEFAIERHNTHISYTIKSK